MSEQTATEHMWANYWGGASRGPNPPLIHQKIRDIRFAVGSVKAEKAQGVMFPVRGAKALFQKLAQACHDHNVLVSTIAQDVSFQDVSAIPDNKTASGKPVFRTLVHVKATVRVAAEDGSFIDFVGSGHGGDVDDKAGGKASTYATKDALFKGFMIPDADVIDTDDEQPSEKKPTKADKIDKGEMGKVLPFTPPENATHLEDVLAAIAGAETLADLEAVAAKIKDGTFPLAGADKLRASTAYVAAKKEINK